jgi:hypothetical protein
MLTGILLYMGGYHLVIAIYQAEVKNEVKSYLKNNPDQSLGTPFDFLLTGNKVSDNRFSWEEENEEFIFNGEYFDVAAISRNGDSLHITAIKDGEENALQEKWQALQQQKNNQAAGNTSTTIKFFPAFCFAAATYDFVIPLQLTNHPCTRNINLTAVPVEFTGPPPRI